MQSPEAYYDAFHAKKRAKVLLFFELTKYFCKKMHLKMHFLYNLLIINGRIFSYFLTIFGRICYKAEKHDLGRVVILYII